MITRNVKHSMIVNFSFLVADNSSFVGFGIASNSFWHLLHTRGVGSRELFDTL